VVGTVTALPDSGVVRSPYLWYVPRHPTWSKWRATRARRTQIALDVFTRRIPAINWLAQPLRVFI